MQTDSSEGLLTHVVFLSCRQLPFLNESIVETDDHGQALRAVVSVGVIVLGKLLSTVDDLQAEHEAATLLSDLIRIAALPGPIQADQFGEVDLLDITIVSDIGIRTWA